MRYASLLRMSFAVASTALIIWEAIVAIAAPATPILKIATKSRSRNMLTIQQIERYMKGLLESPTALNTPASIL